jgi:hypothetical protein
MIAAAGGPWPSRSPRTDSPDDETQPETVGAAFELLERVLELTRTAVERFEEDSVDEALHLLERRDRIFAEAGAVLGRLSAAYADDANQGRLQAAAQRAIIEELTTSAAELGRLDSWIARRLVYLRDRLGAQIAEPAEESGADGRTILDGAGRRLDLRG